MGRGSLLWLLLLACVCSALAAAVDDTTKRVERRRYIGAGVNPPAQYAEEKLPPEVTGGKQMQGGHTITTHAAGPHVHVKTTESEPINRHSHFDKLKWTVEHCPVDPSQPSPLVLSHSYGKCTPVKAGTPAAQKWKLAFNYANCQNASVVNAGNALRVLGLHGQVTSNGITYALEHIDFKSPSDHIVDGKRVDLEMQWVHVKQPGQSNHGNNHMIVSLLFDRCPCGGLAAETAKFFDGLKWSHRRSLEDIRVGRELHFTHTCANLNVFQKSLSGSYFAYEGVRNTPPCSDEVASWVVMTAKNGVYLETLAQIQSTFNGGNNGLAVVPTKSQTVTCFNA